MTQPARNPNANAPAAATGIGFWLAFVDRLVAADDALAGDPCLTFPSSSSFFPVTVAFVSSSFCLACALTSALAASAATVSPSSSRVVSMSRRIS